jgi:hypothetical protein
MTDLDADLRGKKVESDKVSPNGSEARVGRPILSAKDNQIALLAQRGTGEQAELQPVKLTEQTTLKANANAGDRPSSIEAKDALGASTTFSDIKYDGAGNEVKSFIFSLKDPNSGEFEYQLEKNNAGSWDIKDKKDGQWVLDPERKRDFGEITIQRDPKTKAIEIHATGLDARRLGDFVKEDGFMSEQSFRTGDPVTHKAITCKAVKDLLDTALGEQVLGAKPEEILAKLKTAPEQSYSKAKLQEVLEKKEAEAKLLEANDQQIDPLQARNLAVGYRQLIADFEKIAKGKTEVSESDLLKYADEQRDGAVAQVIASSISKYDSVTYPGHLLISQLLDNTALLKKEEVDAVENSINTQLKALGGASSKYSIRFDDKLIDAKFAPGEPEAGFISPQKDRLLTFYKDGKAAGQMRVRQRTDIIYEDEVRR